MPKKKKTIKGITKHVLVPDHVILSEKEKNELIEKYGVELNQLPKILTTDPVAKSIEAESGQVVKIIRKSHTAKESIAYRLAIEDNK